MFAAVQPFGSWPKVWVTYGTEALQGLCRNLETTIPAMAVVNISVCARRLSEALPDTRSTAMPCTVELTE